MESIKVIINADDLGRSAVVNQTTFSLMNKQKVFSTTLIASGPAFKDAVQHIPEFLNCSFGIHLTLSEFPALTRPQVFYDTKLIDENGVFTANFRQIHLSPALLKAIGLEWEQQVIKILDNGVSISHLDSHYHIHTIPWLFLELKKLQKKFNIRKIRISKNLYQGKEPSPYLSLLFSKKIWNWALRNVYATRTTDYFTEFRWFLGLLHDKRINPPCVIELMCHPGQAYGNKETELLCSDWIQKLPFDVKLISYKEL